MNEKKKGGAGKILMVVLVIAIVFFLANHFGLVEMLTDIEGMQNWFQELGFIGYAVFVLVYIIAAVFMLPAAVLTIVAGVTFGSVLGAILALLGATIGATVAFVIAKFVARDAIVSKFQGNALFDKIEKGAEENGVSFLILTRLVPIFPYNVQNYAYGITSIKTLTFAVVSLITMAPGAFIYAFMAGEIATNGFSVTLMVQFAIAGLILFLVSLIPKHIAKKRGIEIEK